MKNVIRFTNPHLDREKIREQACGWLAKLDAGIEDADYEALDSWLNEDSRHLEILLEMADLWDQMTVLSELSEIFPLTRYARHSGRAFWLKGVTAAAVCLIVVFLASLNWMHSPEERSGADQVAIDNTSTYETQVGQQSTIELSDGSQMILNTNTFVETVFTERERRVYLRRGEGLFTVARDQSRPFRVFIGQRVVEAVGTAFTVQRTQNNSVEVMVTEGKVNLRVLHQAIEENSEDQVTEAVLQDSDVLPLVAGEFAAAESEALDSVSTEMIQPEEMEVKLAWQHGMLLFQGDPLDKVLEEFGRYTTIKLEAEEAVRDVKVEGYYRAGDVDRLLIAIVKNFQIDVQEISDDHILLTAR